MSDFTIIAEKRDDLGKGASRRLRHAGVVPGIIYGAGMEPVAFQVKHTELEKMLLHEAFFSSILSLDLEGKKEQVVAKDMQRHPFRNKIMHLDLLRIRASEKIVMNIPVHFINDETCVGVKQGGILNRIITDLEISCLPADLPEYIKVDVQHLEIGDSIHLSEVQLPPGVELSELIHDEEEDQAIIQVQPPVVEEEEAVEDEEAVEKAAEKEEGGEEAGSEE